MLDNSEKSSIKITEKNLNIKNGYKTTILMVRHGESLGNANREFLGHTNKDLSPLGYKQAQRTAESLSEFNIDAVYASDLIRAHNTALPHAILRGMDVVDSVELREIYAGLWEGERVEDIIEKYPSQFLDEWRAEFGICRIPGGESVPELAERIYKEVYRIASENINKTVLIGSHAAAIRAFFGRISGILPQKLADTIPFPTNASVSVVNFDGERLLPGIYSYDEHLSDLFEK